MSGSQGTLGADLSPSTVVPSGSSSPVTMPAVAAAAMGAVQSGQSVAVSALPALAAGTNPIGSTIVTPGALTNSAAAAAGMAATIVVPYSATRKFVHVFSRTIGTETVDLGSSNVTVGGGIPITGGGGFSFVGSGAAGPIYAITTVASSPLSYVEG